jgi:transcriptional regulator with XRE-family HTH domain
MLTCGVRVSIPSEVSARTRFTAHAFHNERFHLSSRTAPVRRQFGQLLKEWRRVRRKSQLDVALEADISPRHLSFVESGRSAPSREMVQLLTETLDVPLRERNALLVAAGYAPTYNEAPLESAELAQVRRALSRLLEHQEPYPAVVLDRQWNVVQTNRAAPTLFSHFIEPAPGPRNLLRTMFDPAGMRPWIANWDVVAQTLVRRVFREAVGGVPDRQVLSLLEELTQYPGSPMPRRAVGIAELPFFPVEFSKDDLRLSFFSMVTTVGAPLDITAQELRIEAFFPADDNTERFAREHLATSP